MNDLLLVLLRYGLAVVAGFIAGTVFSKHKTKKGHTVPAIDRSTRNMTLVSVMLLLISIVAVVNTAVATNKQSACNDEFREALSIRAQITVEDNQLRDRQNALNTEDAVALRDFLKTLLTNPGEEGRVVTMAALQDFQTTINDNSIERDKILAEQAKLNDQRNDTPVPELACGK